MAKKKKDDTLQYLQMPLPSGRKYSKMTKVSFGGLNKRYNIDSGDLSMESNISTSEYPYLTPSNKQKEVLSNYEIPISMFAFDDFLIVVYGENEGDEITPDITIKIDYIVKNRATYTAYTGILKAGGGTFDDCVPRSVIQFNVYDTPTDPISGKFVKKLLIFPDKKSMFFNIDDLLDDKNNDTNNDFKLYSLDDDIVVKSFSSWTKEEYNEETEQYDTITIETPPESASHNYYYQNSNTKQIYKWVDDASNRDNSGWKISIPPTMPNIKYATVHLSRVFGVDDDRVYASGYNDYANWNLDTVDEYNESNSWCSPSQANTKAGGKFTGITTFDSHIICFKRDFMHEIYNTKNPFRLQDIYAEGCIDNRTIQDVDGKLIFVSEDDVKIYTGSNPRIIGYNLNMSQFTYAVSGTDNRNYYLYCEDNKDNAYLYVYDTFTELWSEQSVTDRVVGFAHNKNGMYMLCEDGCVYKMDTSLYSHNWSFETELITNKTVNIKHIKKLQMLVDIPEEVNGIANNADSNGNQANMRVYILYDDEVFDEKSSHLVYTSNKYGRQPIRVKPRKTANYGFKLHIEGAGYVKIYELEMFVEAGGDMYV